MFRRFLRAGIILGLFILGMPAVVFAQYTSPSYKIDEIFIGGGSVQESCSGNQYCSNQSLGGTAVGNTKSNGFQAQAGSQNTEESTLEVEVTNSVIDLGVLNTSSTAAASFNFSVKNYLSNGYVVRILGQPPTNTSGVGSHSLTALNAPNPSVIGEEQFGINLVSNTTPGIGASPVQVPDNSYSFGEPAAGYGDQDYFKYIDGDIIAESTQGTGQTNYTVSIIANIANSTPGGRYQGTLVIQAIATF